MQGVQIEEGFTKKNKDTYQGERVDVDTCCHLDKVVVDTIHTEWRESELGMHCWPCLLPLEQLTPLQLAGSL